MYLHVFNSFIDYTSHFLYLYLSILLPIPLILFTYTSHSLYLYLSFSLPTLSYLFELHNVIMYCNINNIKINLLKNVIL